MQTVVAY